MTYTELVNAISKVLPEATLGEDSLGQIVIYTNLKQISKNDNDKLYEMYKIPHVWTDIVLEKK